MVNNNLILKGIGGFYYVKTADGVLEAKPKGIFRKQGITPLAGDVVEYEQVSGDTVITEIHARKNFFVRPPVANVDNMFLVVSSIDPAPNLLVIDTMTAIARQKGALATIVVTKTDLHNADAFIADYRKAGFEVLVAREQADYARRIEELANGKISMFAGNSGVGKSTLLNEICPGLGLETAQTSKKLGRGKHTTRAVELYDFAGGYLADTPGFSAIDTAQKQPIEKQELPMLFADFAPYTDTCRFNDCTHTVEKGCAVLAAVNAGAVVKTRHESYTTLYKIASERPNY